MTKPDLVDVIIELGDSHKELTERLRVACETIEQLKRVNKEWEVFWKPIDDLVRPLTPLGESVSDKAVELIRDCLEGEPAFWYNPTAKNSVISNASKCTKGTTHLYADWSVPLYD